MGTFINWHRGFNLGVHGGQVSANLNCHKVARDRGHLANAGRGGSSLGEVLKGETNLGMNTWSWRPLKYKPQENLAIAGRNALEQEIVSFRLI
jgi:hypothetical protein